MTFDEIFDAACLDMNLPRFAKTARARQLELFKNIAKTFTRKKPPQGKGFLRGINPWYAVPAIGAGAYGLSRIPGMFSGMGGETAVQHSQPQMEQGFGPSGSKFKDLYRLAQERAQRGF